MAEVIAKLRQGNKEFEVLVDMEKALEFKQGRGNIENVLSIDAIFTDAKKGLKASDEDMKEAFKTTNILEVASNIIKKGTVQLTAEYRKKLRDAKMKQVVAFLTRNCINPQNNLPHPPQRIENAIEEAGAKINEFKQVDEQIKGIIEQIQKVLPIKIEFKKLAIKIPPAYTGKAYSVLHEFMKKEEWLSDGSLVAVIEIPAGLQMDFFNKLNSITQGSAETKELKE